MIELLKNEITQSNQLSAETIHDLKGNNHTLTPKVREEIETAGDEGTVRLVILLKHLMLIKSCKLIDRLFEVLEVGDTFIKNFDSSRLDEALTRFAEQRHELNIINEKYEAGFRDIYKPQHV